MSGVVRAPGVSTGTTGGSTPTTASGPTTTTTRPAPSGQAFQIGLVGDTGYTAGQVTAFDKVVTQMNTYPLAFVTHDGDFKDPRTACSDEQFEAAKQSFNRSTAPFVYAVGDNEWMDCDNMNVNPNEAPMDAVGRLDELREMLFHDDASLGVNQMPLTTQRVWDKAPEPQFSHSFPENARWAKEGVVFATLNAPGPSDDINKTSESHNRRAANLDWLNSAFDVAEATNAPAVMIIWQADPWYATASIDFSPTWRYLTEALEARAQAFGKPVVLVHGDTHICRLDNPFPDAPNVRRLETHGTGDSGNWIRATVDPASPDVFSFASVSAGLTSKGQQEPSCPAVAP